MHSQQRTYQAPSALGCAQHTRSCMRVRDLACSSAHAPVSVRESGRT
jgi:hypothetical protein